MVSGVASVLSAIAGDTTSYSVVDSMVNFNATKDITIGPGNIIHNDKNTASDWVVIEG